MTTETKDGWKKALFILIFVVMAATVFAVTAIAPLSFIHSSQDNNLVSLLDELLTCQSSARKVWIIQTIGALNEPSTTGALQECLGDRHPAVRAAAISAIAKMRGLPALETLAMATQHPDPTVRDLAKWAQLRRATEMSSEEIVESLEDVWQQQQHPESN
jgi:HEAT repeat protein